MARSFFDTNVLIYMYDDDEPEKKSRALAVFEEEIEAGRAALSTQVLQEFYVNTVRGLRTPLSPERAAARVRDFAALTVARVDVPLILAAMARSSRMPLSFWDALVIEAALAVGADRLLTEDLPHGQVIGGMSVENPFL